MRSSGHRSSGATGTAIHELRVDRLEQRDGRVALVLSWAEQSGGRHEWAQVLALRDMQDYASGAKAVRALHRSRLNR